MQASKYWAVAGTNTFMGPFSGKVRVTSFGLQGSAGTLSAKLGNLTSQPIGQRPKRHAAGMLASAPKEVRCTFTHTFC